MSRHEAFGRSAYENGTTFTADVTTITADTTGHTADATYLGRPPMSNVLFPNPHKNDYGWSERSPAPPKLGVSHGR